MEESNCKKRRYMDTMPKKECNLCGDDIPLHLLYAHLRQCIVEYEDTNKLQHTCRCNIVKHEHIAKTEPVPQIQPIQSTMTSSQYSSNDTIYAGAPSHSQPPQAPFNQQNYWLHASQLTEKKSKSKTIRVCSVNGKFCKLKDTPPKKLMVVVHAGERKLIFCRLLHFSASKVIPEIEKLIENAVSEQKKDNVSQETNYYCTKCSSKCNDFFQAGASDVPEDKYLKFCSQKCLMEYFECKRSGEWEAWVNSTSA